MKFSSVIIINYVYAELGAGWANPRRANAINEDLMIQLFSAFVGWGCGSRQNTRGADAYRAHCRSSAPATREIGVPAINTKHMSVVYAKPSK